MKKRGDVKKIRSPGAAFLPATAGREDGPQGKQSDGREDPQTVAAATLADTATEEDNGREENPQQREEIKKKNGREDPHQHEEDEDAKDGRRHTTPSLRSPSPPSLLSRDASHVCQSELPFLSFPTSTDRRFFTVGSASSSSAFGGM